jgi:histidine triad (HIT) family protein
MTDCVFCEIVAGRLPAHVVHEDDRVLAFLDIHPLTPGHTLIIPKRHVPFLADLDQETADRLFSVTLQVAAALRASDLQCEGVNLFLSDGAVAGQEVFHVHMHVIPRFAGDPLGPGRPFGRAPALGNQGELEKTAEQLRHAFTVAAERSR